MGRKKNGSGQVASLTREIARLKLAIEKERMRYAALSGTEKSIEQVEEEVEVASSQSSEEESKQSESRMEDRIFFKDKTNTLKGLERKKGEKRKKKKTELFEPEKSIEEARNEKKALLETIRSLFEDDTQMTEETLTAEFLSLKVHESAVLDDVASIIIDKAIDEPMYGPIYMRMCRAQVAEELKLNKNVSPLRTALLMRVQDTFTKKYLDEDTIREQLAATKKNKGNKKYELKKARKQFSWRKLGNIKVLGLMYRYGLASVRIIHSCVVDLLKEAFEKPDHYYPLNENIEGAMLLLEIRLRDGDENKFPFDDCFQKLEEALPFVRIRTKFMIVKLLKLRARGWKKSGEARSELKTLEEIRVAIERRKQKQDYQLKMKQVRAARKARNSKTSGI